MLPPIQKEIDGCACSCLEQKILRYLKDTSKIQYNCTDSYQCQWIHCMTCESLISLDEDIVPHNKLRRPFDTVLRTHFCTYGIRRIVGVLRLPQMLKIYFRYPRQTAKSSCQIAHWDQLNCYFYSNIVAFGIIIAQSIYSLLMRDFRGNLQTG